MSESMDTINNSETSKPADIVGPEGDKQEPSAAGSSTSQNDSTFECNICLDTAREAVISLCGHLFCWSCLHQWLETRPNRQVCPVCKSAIGRDKVVPLYGRHGDNKDPREKLPPRPQGQRSEPTGANFNGFNMAGIGGDGGFQFSFGIGAFPFTLFASALNFGDQRPAAPAPNTVQYEAELMLTRLFIVVGVVFTLWLLIV